MVIIFLLNFYFDFILSIHENQWRIMCPIQKVYICIIYFIDIQVLKKDRVQVNQYPWGLIYNLNNYHRLNQL